MGRGLLMEMRSTLNKKGSNETDSYLQLMEGLMSERPLSHDAIWYNEDPQFQEAVNETLRLKREVMNVPTLEAKKLEGDAVAQLLGETLSTKSKVSFIPDTAFREFRLLKVLNLDGFGGITTLPKTLGGLSDLHTLHLRECEALERLPVEIGKLRKLSTLNMTSCKELQDLPSQIGQLSSLTALDLGFCRALTVLPTEIGKLTQLQTLKLQQCSGLLELPASIGQLTALKVLTLYGCSTLTAIPDSIGSLPELQELNLRACSAILELPPTFGANLPNLQTLDLTLCKGLTTLPDSIGKLRSLQTFFLGNCFNIPQFPATITNLRSLVTLNLYNCGGIKALPDTFDELESLQVLSLQGCEKLIEVPESLARCMSLTTLTLWNCQALEKIPDLTPIPKLQIDGVPEQLEEWEAEYKRKRAEEAKGGGKNPATAQVAKTSGWAAVKKGHALIGTAASMAGQAKSREQLQAAVFKNDGTGLSVGAAAAAEPAGDDAKASGGAAEGA
jgi:Leucine-rich repeat (LRR) protein